MTTMLRTVSQTIVQMMSPRAPALVTASIIFLRSKHWDRKLFLDSRIAAWSQFHKWFLATCYLEQWRSRVDCDLAANVGGALSAVSAELWDESGCGGLPDGALAGPEEHGRSVRLPARLVRHDSAAKQVKLSLPWYQVTMTQFGLVSICSVHVTTMSYIV